jgi:twinkle protein
MIIPSSVDFSEYIDFIGSQESQEIHPAGYWTEDMLERLRKGETISGDYMPWDKLDDKVRLRRGELSLWAGYSGHKKSLMLGWIMLCLAQEKKIAIASLELSPVDTLHRMMYQAAGLSEGSIVSENFARKFMDWADPNIAIYDQLDSVPPEKILGFVNYCAKELKCEHIVIDSLTKCGIAKDDTVSEKLFADKLQWAAKTLGCHVHLVCHMRKPQDGQEQRLPTKAAIRGASEISDLADNVFLVWQNMKKKTIMEKQIAGVELKESELAEVEKPDQILVVDKQRHGKWEGSVGLWTHASQQFLQGSSLKPKYFALERQL